MKNENYDVLWKDFPSHLGEMMKNFRNDKFTDVTLICNDKKEIRAHKNILSACSSLFKDLFNSFSMPAIYLRGIDHAEMEAILQFMYIGEVTLTQEKLEEFMAVAKSLEISQLVKKQQIDEEKNHFIKEELSEEISEDRSVKDSTLKLPKTKTKRVNGSKYYIKIGSEYKCVDCDKTFARDGHAIRHKKSTHDGIKFDCSFCGYQANRPEVLKSHIQAKHEGIKYNCDICKYSTSWKNEMKKHVIICKDLQKNT